MYITTITSLLTDPNGNTLVSISNPIGSGNLLRISRIEIDSVSLIDACVLVSDTVPIDGEIMLSHDEYGNYGETEFVVLSNPKLSNKTRALKYGSIVGNRVIISPTDKIVLQEGKTIAIRAIQTNTITPRVNITINFSAKEE